MLPAWFLLAHPFPLPPFPIHCDSLEACSVECWQCRGSIFLCVCIWLCVAGREGGREGGAFPLKHALLTVSQILRISSISLLLLSSAHSLYPPPLHFWSIRHFLPVALFSVSHVNPSRAGAHICQTCIVSALTPPLYCFPDQSGCCISIAAAAFCIFCLIAVSGIWSRPRWVY